MGKRASDQTMQHIKAAFIRLYSTRDIANITVKDVCQEVPISRNTFYNYYDNVYSIYDDIETNVLTDLDKFTIDFSESDFLGGDLEKLHGISEVLDYIKDNADIFRALLRHGSTNGFTYRWKKQIKGKFGRKYAKEIFHKAEEEVYLTFTVSGITGVCEYWVFHLDELVKQDILEGIYNMVCHEKRP